jgi:hypothetical protein
MRGALAAAVAVMINTAWVLARPYAVAARTKALVVFVGALAIVRLAPLSPFQVLLVAAVVGAAWPARRGAP